MPEPTRYTYTPEELQASKDRLVARIKGANPQASTPEPQTEDGSCKS